MKIIFLLFAVLFLVFQTQSGATAMAIDEAQPQVPNQAETESQDEFMAEDAAAELSSPGLARGGPRLCQIRGGICRGFCWLNEYASGRCFTGKLCCSRRN